MNTQNQTPQNGFLTESGNRWCATCGREHGRSFICASYSEDIVALIKAEEELRDLVPLPYGVPGDGISDLLAPFTRRAS